jgi:hypothetical protein
MYVKSNVNMIGVMITSNSWKGTCLILSIARHASVSTADSAEGGAGVGPAASTLCTSPTASIAPVVMDAV